MLHLYVSQPPKEIAGFNLVRLVFWTRDAETKKLLTSWNVREIEHLAEKGNQIPRGATVTLAEMPAGVREPRKHYRRDKDGNEILDDKGEKILDLSLDEAGNQTYRWVWYEIPASTSVRLPTTLKDCVGKSPAAKTGTFAAPEISEAE